MGIEYKILCAPAALTDFDSFIRGQPFFQSYDEQHKLYNLRLTEIPKEHDFPDCYVSLDTDGIYLCDNLTAKNSAACIFRRLIDYALGHSERITIVEP